MFNYGLDEFVIAVNIWHVLLLQNNILWLSFLAFSFLKGD